MVTNNFYYITISTKSHPILQKLIQKVQQNGEHIEVLGEQENRVIGWENQQRFGIKLREVADYLKRPHLKPDDIILFTDAYDIAYFGTKNELIERYLKLSYPIVFGCENECHPDPQKSVLYTKTDVEFPYLNSGMFIGRVYALRKCIETYKYNDTDDDQRWWTNQYLENPDLITLDYENTIFLNTSGFHRHFFMFDIENSIAIYKNNNPLFVHVNGPDKTFIHELYK